MRSRPESPPRALRARAKALRWVPAAIFLRGPARPVTVTRALPLLLGTVSLNGRTQETVTAGTRGDEFASFLAFHSS